MSSESRQTEEQPAATKTRAVNLLLLGSVYRLLGALLLIVMVA